MNIAAIAITIVFLLGALGTGVQSVRLGNVQEDLAREKSERITERNELLEVAAAELKTQADETKRRLAAQKENQDAQDKKLAAAVAAADRASGVADRLRQQNTALAAAGRRPAGVDPTTGLVSAATGDALVVLAELFDGADRTAGELAAALDRSNAAGLKCAADYDALQTKPVK